MALVRHNAKADSVPDEDQALGILLAQALARWSRGDIGAQDALIEQTIVVSPDGSRLLAEALMPRFQVLIRTLNPVCAHCEEQDE